MKVLPFNNRAEMSPPNPPAVKAKEDLHPDMESQGMNDDTFCEYRWAALQREAAVPKCAEEMTFFISLKCILLQQY